MTISDFYQSQRRILPPASSCPWKDRRPYSPWTSLLRGRKPETANNRRFRAAVGAFSSSTKTNTFSTASPLPARPFTTKYSATKNAIYTHNHTKLRLPRTHHLCAIGQLRALGVRKLFRSEVAQEIVSGSRDGCGWSSRRNWKADEGREWG